MTGLEMTGAKRKAVETMDRTLWKCEQVRAGEVYDRAWFETREQAERFAAKMGEVQPDLFFRIAPEDATHVWN